MKIGLSLVPAVLFAAACAPAATAPATTATTPPTSQPVLRTVTPPTPSGFPGGITNATGPLQAGFTRYSGTVVDVATDDSVQGVCVYAGPPSGCPTPSLVTRSDGSWAFDFPSGISWPFNFEHPSYKPAIQQIGVKLEIKLEPKPEPKPK